MRPCTHLPLIALLFLAAPSAPAVVHVTGDGSGNTQAPLDDPGFANVGISANNLTGVYLGERWVLSAHHVGEHGFSFGGVSYPVVPGSRVQLLTSPGVGADLQLVRIVGEPPLPAPLLSGGPPLVDEVVTLIGNGWDRQAAQTCWNASYAEVSCPPPGPQPAYRGYERLGSQRTLRWGRNVVTESGAIWELAGRSSVAFEMAFDESGVADEAQAVPGDSGGAVFALRGGQWELVGVMFAATNFVDQPANTAMFGQSTLAVDLHPYLDQIDAILHPPAVIPLAPLPAMLGLGSLLLALARRALPRR